MLLPKVTFLADTNFISIDFYTLKLPELWETLQRTVRLGLLLSCLKALHQVIRTDCPLMTFIVCSLAACVYEVNFSYVISSKSRRVQNKMQPLNVANKLEISPCNQVEASWLNCGKFYHVSM